MPESCVDSTEKRLEEISSRPFQYFVRENHDNDITKLILAGSTINIKEAADQILSRRKAKDKLPDWYAAESIVFPPPLSIEQCSSQQAAAYKKNLLSGSHLVDLTGGMGVDCLALSESFDQVTYVEQNDWLCTLFSHNQQIFTDKEIQVRNTSAEAYLDEFTGKATFFIDPARRDENQNKVFRFEDCSPDLTLLLDQLKEKADKVLIKAAPLIDLSLGINQLQHVEEVHVLSIKNEVKEVLFILDFAFHGEPVIRCRNIGEHPSAFSFKFSEEKGTRLIHGDIRKYLYDPNSAILKAGGFKSVAVHYPVQKLGTNTHLYTSKTLIRDFPGRTFEVLNPDLKKKELHEWLPEERANVFTKNYPLKPDALKKKLDLKDGGDHFVIGFRDNADRPKVVLAKSR